MSDISKADIVNWALVTHLGVPASFSIDDDSNLGTIVDNVWQFVVDETFGLADWTFARKTLKLTRLDAAPVTGWTYAYALPDGMIGNPLAVSRDPSCREDNLIRRYYLESNELHCNEATVYLRCKREIPPESWDPAFRAAFTVLLAGYLAVPVNQDDNLRDDLITRAKGTPSQGETGGMFGRIIAQNRAGSPLGSPFEGNDVLVDARNTGVTPNWWGRW